VSAPFRGRVVAWESPLTVRAMSFGGGVQSTAMLVLAARGEIDYRLALFCNVGEDSEHPDTLVYVENVVKPYAARHGIEFKELRRTKRDGTFETVYQRATGPNRTISVPVRMKSGAPGRRECTNDFKRKVIAKEAKARGATKDKQAVVALGISTEEITRMRSDSGFPHIVSDYPLIELGLDRDAAKDVIRDAGLPVPGKSSCWFCMFKRKAEWEIMRRERPDLFQRSVDMERRINEKRALFGKDPVFFSSTGLPLDIAFSNPYLFDYDDAACDVAGYCGV
jgi:hypothetical protein